MRGYIPKSYKKNPSFIVYRSAGIYATADRTVEAHDGSNGIVDFLCGFFLVCFDVSSKICTDENVVHHPAQYKVTAVGDFLLQGQLHQLFGRRRHILEALTERYHRKSNALKVLHYLNSAPAIKGNFMDIEFFTQLLDELFDIAVVDHISFGGLQEALLLPDIVWNMVTAHSKLQCIFRYPEVREDHVFIIFIQWREHQYKSYDVCGGRKVQANVTYMAS